MHEAYKTALKTNLDARKAERRILAAKIKVLDKQINDLKTLIKGAEAKPEAEPKPAKSATKPKKRARKSIE